MTSRVRHRPHAKRNDLPVRVSPVAGHGFRLPDVSKRRPTVGVREKQNANLSYRKDVPITLPTLSILKD